MLSFATHSGVGGGKASVGGTKGKVEKH